MAGVGSNLQRKKIIIFKKKEEKKVGIRTTSVAWNLKEMNETPSTCLKTSFSCLVFGSVLFYGIQYWLPKHAKLRVYWWLYKCEQTK